MERLIKHKITQYHHPVRRNSLLLTTHNGLHGMLFILPVLLPYYIDVLGLSFRDFLLGEIAFTAVVVLMEVPSGWLSDVWRRKYVLALGSFFNAVGFTALFLADGFWSALVGQSIVGIGVSLVSGTNTALLYDTLLSYRQQKHYRRLEGQRHSSGLYIAGLASLIGGVLYTINPYLPMFMTIVVYVAALGVALCVHEPFRHKAVVEKSPFHDLAATIRYALHGHKYVAALIAFTAILFGTTQAGMWIQQPYWLKLGIDELYFGVLLSVGLLFAGLGSSFGHMLDKHFKPETIFAVMLCAVAAAYLVAGSMISFAALFLLYTSSVAYGVGMPAIQLAINDHVGSARRATILSTAMLCARFVFLPIAAIVGYIEELHHVGYALLFMGGFLIAGGLFVMFMFRSAYIGNQHSK